jgi:hypothetical protein
MRIVLVFVQAVSNKVDVSAARGLAWMERLERYSCEDIRNDDDDDKMLFDGMGSSGVRSFVRSLAMGRT